MNYASVLLVGFMALAAVWYVVYARKGEKLVVMVALFALLISSQCTKVRLHPMVSQHRRYDPQIAIEHADFANRLAKLAHRLLFNSI